MRWRWMIGAVGLAAALGCGGLLHSKATECSALVDVINPAAVEFDRLSAMDMGDIDSATAGLKALAALSRRVAAQVDALELSHEELVVQAAQYSAMCRRLATIAEEMAAALQTLDTLEVRMPAHTTAIHAALQDLAATCSGGRDARSCVQVVRRLPADLSTQASLGQYLQEVEDITMTDPGTQEALARLLAVLEAVQTAVTEAQALKARVETLQAEMQAVTDQEDPVIDTLNALCQG